MFSHFAAGTTCLGESSSDNSIALANASWSFLNITELSWVVESLACLVWLVNVHTHGVVWVIELFLAHRVML